MTDCKYLLEASPIYSNITLDTVMETCCKNKAIIETDFDIRYYCYREWALKQVDLVYYNFHRYLST